MTARCDGAMQWRIPVTIMRGGTSRGLFFHNDDLPADPSERDRLILAAFGSPDTYGKQIDGLGGATATTNKLAIISEGDGVISDVDFEFGQVAVDRALIDRNGTCGNISSAVGPYALAKRMVKVDESQMEATIRVRDVNTNHVFVVRLPMQHGRFDPRGAFRIAGIPGTGARVEVEHENPGGSTTGRLLPTGSPSDTVRVRNLGDVEVSIVDVVNPFVFCAFESVHVTGAQTPAAIDSDPAVLEKLEAVRSAAAIAAGMAADIDSVSPAVPKLVLVGRSDDDPMAATAADIRILAMSMGRAHPAIQGSGALCLAVTQRIPGTVVAAKAGLVPDGAPIRIRTPAGVLEARSHVVVDEDGDANALTASITRTARQILDGVVHIDLPD